VGPYNTAFLGLATLSRKTLEILVLCTFIIVIGFTISLISNLLRKYVVKKTALYDDGWKVAFPSRTLWLAGAVISAVTGIAFGIAPIVIPSYKPMSLGQTMLFSIFFIGLFVGGAAYQIYELRNRKVRWNETYFEITNLWGKRERFIWSNYKYDLIADGWSNFPPYSKLKLTHYLGRTVTFSPYWDGMAEFRDDAVRLTRAAQPRQQQPLDQIQPST
jgi:hypothetical protein